ncbi:MAG: hypothetical protein QNK37_03530 [Acidobacteriota bacterium]|nr:hypothetical protein [Acidobacteriota bacterium]
MHYQIADEPQPGGMAKLAVRPIWPLFAIMFAGGWLAFSWFVFNAFAIGDPNRMKTLVLAIFSFVGSALLAFTTLFLGSQLDWGPYHYRYAFLILLVWKLGMAYYIMLIQSRTFDLYEHFGGTTVNGLFMVIIGYFVSKGLYAQLPTFMILVVR